MSLQFNLGRTLVEPLKLWTSPFNGSLNGPDLKTMVDYVIWCTSVQNPNFISIGSLLIGLTTNIECCILRHVEYENGSQDSILLERALGFIVELAEWITFLVPNIEAWLEI